MVLWSNSSSIRLEGWGFKSRCRGQKSFSIQIDKNLFEEVKAEEKGKLSLIASVRAVAVRVEEETRRERERNEGIIWSINLSGGAIWQCLCNINKLLLLRNIDGEFPLWGVQIKKQLCAYDVKRWWNGSGQSLPTCLGNIHNSRGQSYKAKFGINYIKNGLNKLNFTFIVIRYKVYNEQHPRAGQKTQHVLFEQQARAGRNT